MNKFDYSYIKEVVIREFNRIQISTRLDRMDTLQEPLNFYDPKLIPRTKLTFSFICNAKQFKVLDPLIKYSHVRHYREYDNVIVKRASLSEPIALGYIDSLSYECEMELLVHGNNMTRFVEEFRKTVEPLFHEIESAKFDIEVEELLSHESKYNESDGY